VAKKRTYKGIGIGVKGFKDGVNGKSDEEEKTEERAIINYKHLQFLKEYFTGLFCVYEYK